MKAILTSLAARKWLLRGAGRVEHGRGAGMGCEGVCLARSAETLMRHQLDESLQIPDLCSALRVSRRKLEYAFRSTFDQSPRDFLQALRLNAIRRELHGSDAPIIDIAFQHGMSHLGRFAASYRHLFGEKPSQTARGVR